MSDEVKKRGSGRTKGSVSLVSVKMKVLKEKFSDEDFVTVGRIFVQKAGILVTAPAISAPATEEVKAGITLTE